MDLTSAKHDASDDDIDAFHKKLQEEIQKIMDSPIVIRPAMDLLHLPNPLPPFKPDDVNFEKLDWIIPPIPVKSEDECRKENCNDTSNQKTDCNDVHQATVEFINGLDPDFVIDKIVITEDEAVVEFHQMKGSQSAL